MNTYNHFEYLVKHYFNLHKLDDWKFEWNKRKTQLGFCDYFKKTISMSIYYYDTRSIDESINTLLHEIAHAIVGSKHGHNIIWKLKAKEIGSDGKRTHKTNIKLLHNYEAICPKCGRLHIAYRLKRHDCCCGVCCNKYEPENKLIYKKVR